MNLDSLTDFVHEGVLSMAAEALIAKELTWLIWLTLILVVILREYRRHRLATAKHQSHNH